MAQLAAWPLVLGLYFRNESELGFREGLLPLAVATMVVACGMAIACSSVLAGVYLRTPPRWLTGVRAIPIAVVLSLLAALLWTTVMTPLVAGGMSIGWSQYGSWFFFHASILMTAWSGAFLWFMHSDRASKTQTRVLHTEALALEPEPSSPRAADRALAPTRSDTSNPAPESGTLQWSLDDRVRLQEGKRVRLCRVGSIAYIRAAHDYTEVHLLSGEVAMVKQRLRYWESRLPESFVRIHRSTLINLELSEELEYVDGAWRVRLRGCAEPLTVSRRFAQALKAKVVGRKGGLPP